jgi:hypothetical protein
MIAAGGKIVCNKKDGVIGAVIKENDKYYVLTAYHVLKAGGCDIGDDVQVDGYSGRVVKFLYYHDLAVIEIDAPEEEIETSNIASPELGPAYSLNGTKRIKCNVMTTGKTFHYLSFPMGDMPLPGDSGSPIIQGDKVVGVLASIFFNNATGIAVSLEDFYTDFENSH